MQTTDKNELGKENLFKKVFIFYILTDLKMRLKRKLTVGTPALRYWLLTFNRSLSSWALDLYSD